MNRGDERSKHRICSRILLASYDLNDVFLAGHAKFLCVFFFLARVSPIFQLVQFPTKNYTAENYDLESTKIHGFGFVDVLIPT